MKINMTPYSYVGTINPLTVGFKRGNEYISDIIFNVVEMFDGVNKEFIMDKSRIKSYREARQLIHYLFSEFTDFTDKKIASLTNRHRTTVLHSIKTVKNVLSYNRKLQEKIELMKEEISRRIIIEENKIVGI